MCPAVFNGVTPSQLAAFYFDSHYKISWDESCTRLEALPPPLLAATGTQPPPPSQQHMDWESASQARSAFLYARSRFPTPMAQREYLYARRVWSKADDGGCYMVSRGMTTHPCPPATSGRTVRVTDFVSGCVIRCGLGNTLLVSAS